MNFVLKETDRLQHVGKRLAVSTKRVKVITQTDPAANISFIISRAVLIVELKRPRYLGLGKCFQGEGEERSEHKQRPKT